MTDDPHAPLREDVRLLGGLLGDTLKQQEGDALFQTVERVRALSKAARGGAKQSAAELEALLHQLPVNDAASLARAFSSFLTLANMAEQHHRVRRRKQYERETQ